LIDEFEMTAVEDGDNVFLLWNDISGFCLPPLLLVRLPMVSSLRSKLIPSLSLFSMRYSRMLEESSFANKKADYFWLLLQSSVMLLVRFSHSTHTFFFVL